MTGKIAFAKDENIKTLVGLGLSGTEAKVCLTLVTIGTSTIRQISEASGVARSETYCAIVELEKKGFIEKSLSTPTKYSLLPLHDLLSSLIGQKDRESLELQEKSAKLLNEYEQKSTDHQSGSDGQFVLVPSAKLFSNRLEDLIENAQESVCIVATQKEFMNLFASQSDPLERVFQKQVAFNVATEKRRSNRLTKLMRGLQKKAHLEFRYLSILPVFSLATFDGKKMLLSINSHTTKGKLNAVYSNNLGLVELAQNYFNGLWSAGIEPFDLEFRRTKLQFDYLFKNMNSGFGYSKMIFDDENRPVDCVFLQINDAFERIMGLKRSQVIGKRVSKIIPGFEKENRELLEMSGRVCQTQKAEQCEIFFKERLPTLPDRWRHISVYSPKKGYVAVLFEDITERKKNESELKHRYDLLESVGENVDAGLAIVDKAYRIVWVNSMLKRVGACPGKLCYQTLAHSEAVCPDCGVKKIFEENIPLDIHEYKGIDSKGKTNWVELRVTPIKDENGNVTSALELAVPITEHKKLEDTLKKNLKSVETA